MLLQKNFTLTSRMKSISFETGSHVCTWQSAGLLATRKAECSRPFLQARRLLQVWSFLRNKHLSSWCNFQLFLLLAYSILLQIKKKNEKKKKTRRNIAERREKIKLIKGQARFIKWWKKNDRFNFSFKFKFFVLGRSAQWQLQQVAEHIRDIHKECVAEQSSRKDRRAEGNVCDMNFYPCVRGGKEETVLYSVPIPQEHWTWNFMDLSWWTDISLYPSRWWSHEAFSNFFFFFLFSSRDRVFLKKIDKHRIFDREAEESRKNIGSNEFVLQFSSRTNKTFSINLINGTAKLVER